MKSILQVVLILLIGMISLNGYSSTTTHTTKKKDAIEMQVPLHVSVKLIALQTVSVETAVNDVGNTSKHLFYQKNYLVKTPNLNTLSKWPPGGDNNS